MPFISTDVVARATAVASQMVEPIVALASRIAEVAAPTNEEAERAAFVAACFARVDLTEIQHDDLHDVVGTIPGMDRSRAILLAAHLDTVFPRSTRIAVSRKGDVLAGPGIGDNSVSVASVALVKTALDQLGITPAVDILVTGNVGEEGLGDLRGMRRVMDDRPQIGGVIAVEGHSLGRITNRAVGSRRLRVAITGPGGHSWGDAGRKSAIHEASRLVARLDDIPLATDPKTSLNVGLFNGGISVNTIAPEVTLVIDMRSTSAEDLATLVARATREIDQTASDVMSVRVKVVGDRPAGQLPDGGMVALGVDVLRRLKIEATCDASSTDANIPISRGIPSMCIGLTTGGNVHRDDEFIRIRPLGTGFAQLLLATIASADALANNSLS